MNFESFRRGCLATAVSVFGQSTLDDKVIQKLYECATAVTPAAAPHMTGIERKQLAVARDDVTSSCLEAATLCRFKESTSRFKESTHSSRQEATTSDSDDDNGRHRAGGTIADWYATIQSEREASPVLCDAPRSKRKQRTPSPVKCEKCQEMIGSSARSGYCACVIQAQTMCSNCGNIYSGGAQCCCISDGGDTPTQSPK